MMSPSKLAASLVLAALLLAAADAKLLRRSRYFDESPYDSPYGSHSGPTGERAILTVRGARSPYDGAAPSKITIEDQAHRGAYPRGVYDRLDGYSGARHPMRPLGSGLYPALRPEPYMGYAPGPYGGSGAGPRFGAPSRIAVTGAYPYGYGSRF